MLIYLIVSIGLLFILCRCIYNLRNKSERFVINRMGIDKLKRRISKITKLGFEKQKYKPVVKYIIKIKKTNNMELLDIIYDHYNKHGDKKGFKEYVVEKTSLMNETDSLECVLFKKCDKTGTSGMCGTLLSNISKSMKETEDCAHYKSVLNDIKQLVNEKSGSKEE